MSGSAEDGSSHSDDSKTEIEPTDLEPLMEAPKKRTSLLHQLSDITKEDETDSEFIFADCYQTSIVGQIFKWLLFVCTGFLAGLVYLWYLPSNFVFDRRCKPEIGTKFLIYTVHGTWVSRPVHEYKGIRYFEFNGLRYIFNGTKFKLASFVDRTWTHRNIARMTDGLDTSNISPYVKVNEGDNLIDVPVEPFYIMLAHELLDPNNIYIYACCLLWFLHEYVAFACLILATSLISSVFTMVTTRKSKLEIKRMARYEADVDVFRDGKWTSLSSGLLLPGDLVSLPEKMEKTWKAPCDMAVISGSAIVDETSLTGESLPVVKLRIKDDPKKFYNNEKDKAITVYGGTNVIGHVPSSEKGKFGGRTVAVVTRTSWKTAKGHLIRSILSVKPHVYQYQREAIYFLVGLIGVGICLFIISLWQWGSFDPSVEWDNENIAYGFETIAILVPPMLPALFHVCILAAAQTLKEEYNIYSTDPSRIPLSGKIDVMCFDKTGTLTKDDLDMIGVVPADPTKKGQMSEDILKIGSIAETAPKFLDCLATCHMLNKNVFANGTGQLYSGPQVDVKIFTSTEWSYEDPADENGCSIVTDPSGDRKLEILKRFDFDPALQRMSAIVRDPLTKEVFVVCKGSPEVIGTICHDSSLPRTYQADSKIHSQNGCYVLAVGCRSASKLDIKNLNSVTRHDIETNLDFMGLVLLRNELKPDTTEAIRQLKKGRIRCVIITGDNVFTAFYIAKKCRLVGASRECFIGDVEPPHKDKVVFRSAYNSDRKLDISDYTITDMSSGKKDKVTKKDVSIGVTTSAWDALMMSSDNASFLINDVKIFARMKPLQKEAVIKLISSADHTVGMCGDGANDCAALSAAHCGVALSLAEASVVSPFTARDLKISSVVTLVREARGALANSFAVFKYTIVYGITQTTQCLMAYIYGADLSEAMYLTIDFGFFLPLAYFVVMSRSSKKLSGDPPTARVFGPGTLVSLFGQAVIMLLFLIGSLVLLGQQPWYTKSTLGDDTWSLIPETTTVWLVGAFSYAGTAIAFSFGHRWRKPFYYNFFLLFLCAWVVLLTTILIFTYPENDPQSIMKGLDLVILPLYFRIDILLLGWGLFFAQILFEKVVVTGIVGDMVRKAADSARQVEDDDDDGGPDEVEVEGEVPLEVVASARANGGKDKAKSKARAKEEDVEVSGKGKGKAKAKSKSKSEDIDKEDSDKGSDKDSSEKDRSEKDSSEKDSSEKESSEKDSSEKDSSEKESIKDSENDKEESEQADDSS